MHEIDKMLQLQLVGEHQAAKELSDRLENIGKDQILDPNGKNTEDIWFRHCFNRGWFKLQEGEYQEGSQLLEYGRFLQVYGSPPLKTTKPIYNPDQHDLEGRSLIISLEGGFGDEIIHARFATSFKKKGAKKVYIAAAPELVSLLERIEGVDGVILRDQADTIEHDYWLPGFSAGWLAGYNYDTLPSDPYLNANPGSQQIWKSIINSDKIKVGIRWAGNPKFEHQQFRRFPEEFIINLSKYKELQLYSFQKDFNTVNLPENVVDLNNLLISWEDTAAAISCLDIVITSCTSVAHLSAALGKETWVLTPILPYHTWTYQCPESNTSPYYKSITLYRQRTPGKWNDCFQQLYKDIEQRFNLEHIDLPDQDKTYQKLNLGCGVKHASGFINVDRSQIFSPDECVDLEVFPWPWADNSIDHIIAKDVLEHLGDTSQDFINIIKEMYRVSANGALWEIQVPHWRSDNALGDLTHKQIITKNTFQLFDRQYAYDKLKSGYSESLLAFEHDIDLMICGTEFDYAKNWQDRIAKNQISVEELEYALNTFNNVAISTRLLIQVHKPGRFNNNELMALIDDLQRP